MRGGPGREGTRVERGDQDWGSQGGHKEGAWQSEGDQDWGTRVDKGLGVWTSGFAPPPLHPHEEPNSNHKNLALFLVW